jgi:hypothetical protein
MRHNPGAVRWWTICGVVLLALEAWAVFVRQTPALRIQGSHTAPVHEFYNGIPVSQTFQMVGSDLNAIAVQFSTDEPVTFVVQCDVLPTVPAAAADAAAPRYSWATTVKRVAGTEWRRIELPTTIQSSHLGTYTFRLQLIAAARAEEPLRQRIGNGPWPRVAIIASTDNVIGGGSFVVGEDRQVGSLSMRAFTTRRTAYERFQADVAPTLPPVLRHAGVAIALAILYQWALFTVAYNLIGDALMSPARRMARERPQAL